MAEKQSQITSYFPSFKSRSNSSKPFPSDSATPRSPKSEPSIPRPITPRVAISDPVTPNLSTQDHEESTVHKLETEKPSLKRGFPDIRDIFGIVARSKRARARARAETARVTNAIRRIQDLRDGRRVGDESFVKIALSGPEYNQLLDRIGRKPELQRYFNDELRQACLEYGRL